MVSYNKYKKKQLQTKHKKKNKTQSIVENTYNFQCVNWVKKEWYF